MNFFHYEYCRSFTGTFIESGQLDWIKLGTRPFEFNVDCKLRLGDVEGYILRHHPTGATLTGSDCQEIETQIMEELYLDPPVSSSSTSASSSIRDAITQAMDPMLDDENNMIACAETQVMEDTIYEDDKSRSDSEKSLQGSC